MWVRRLRHGSSEVGALVEREITSKVHGDGIGMSVCWDAPEVSTHSAAARKAPTRWTGAAPTLWFRIDGGRPRRRVAVIVSPLDLLEQARSRVFLTVFAVTAVTAAIPDRRRVRVSTNTMPVVYGVCCGTTSSPAVPSPRLDGEVGWRTGWPRGTPMVRGQTPGVTGTEP